jgi:hypothetical protein
MNKICSKCGIEKDFDEFYTRAIACKECQKADQKRRNINNREAIAARKKLRYMENREKNLIEKQLYYKANKEKLDQKSRLYAIENPEKMRAAWRKYRNKKMSTPKGKLNNSIAARVNHSLIGGKAGRSWEELVGFTVDQLKTHLEKRFKPGMTWDNYGTVWSIDHKIPISVFNFEKPDDIDFHLCWSLKNLQPLEVKANSSKRNKLEKPFQPSLALRVAQGGCHE